MSVYALIDRPIALLGLADRLLLDAMRAWVHALTLAGDPGLARVEAPGSDRQAAFDAAMRALDRGSVDTLTFQRPCHATVEEDEAVVLGLWHLAQRDRIGDARAAAERLVDPASARTLIRAMVEFGALAD